MTAAITVRAARRGDLPALTTLLIAQLRDHGNDVPDDELAVAARGMLERPQRGQFLLALEGETVVGLAALSYLWTLERGGRAAWLDELYVLPERRDAGIGAALVTAAIATARAAGALAVDLEIEAGHERAAALYRRSGFAPLSRQHWTLRLAPATHSTPPPARAPLTGGCCCGAVRYAVDAAPVDVCHCHCGLCRRSSGAPVVTWLTVPRSSLRLLNGTPRERRSSARAVRGFCADCGTALTFRADAHPETVDVTVASLDQPELMAPREHIWTRSALPWMRLDDDLPRYDERVPVSR
jgi:GNAT superfamily N-acetyltransferase